MPVRLTLDALHGTVMSNACLQFCLGPLTPLNAQSFSVHMGMFSLCFCMLEVYLILQFSMSSQPKADLSFNIDFQFAVLDNAGSFSDSWETYYIIFYYKFYIAWTSVMTGWNVVFKEMCSVQVEKQQAWVS